MSPESQHAFEDRKAFELSFVCFRIAERLTNQGLKTAFERYGLALLDAVTGGRYPQALPALKSLEYHLRLCAELGLISLTSTKVLLGEVASLRESLQKLGTPLKAEEEDIKELFPSKTFDTRQAQHLSISDIQPNGNQAAKAESKKDIADYSNGNSLKASQPKEPAKEIVSTTTNPVSYSSRKELPADQRQAKILQKIREAGSCRLKELQEILPDVSERTIRYDLQKLLEEDVVERVGGGGPFSYYRPKSLSLPKPAGETVERNLLGNSSL